MRLAQIRTVRLCSALVLALVGDSTGAERSADEINKSFPLWRTRMQRYWLPMIGAAIALERNDPNRAVELLQAVASFSPSDPDSIYLRGQAYLQLRNGAAAGLEFQKIIDHRGLFGNNPLGALAHVGVGRAYALQGDNAKARAAYQEFLTLWKDADPDISILQQAKAEYARLQ